MQNDRFDRIVNTIKSKYKRGTCNFNCLATVNCIVEGSRAFLGAKLFLPIQLPDEEKRHGPKCLTRRGSRLPFCQMQRRKHQGCLSADGNTAEFS